MKRLLRSQVLAGAALSVLTGLLPALLPGQVHAQPAAIEAQVSYFAPRLTVLGLDAAASVQDPLRATVSLGGEPVVGSSRESAVLFGEADATSGVLRALARAPLEPSVAYSGQTEVQSRLTATGLTIAGPAGATPIVNLRLGVNGTFGFSAGGDFGAINQMATGSLQVTPRSGTLLAQVATAPDLLARVDYFHAQQPGGIGGVQATPTAGAFGLASIGAATERAFIADASLSFEVRVGEPFDLQASLVALAVGGGGWTAESDLAQTAHLSIALPAGFTLESAGDALLSQAAVVPEPATWVLLAGGIALLWGAARRRRSIPFQSVPPASIATSSARLRLLQSEARVGRPTPSSSGKGQTALGALGTLGTALLLGSPAAPVQAAPSQSTVQLGCSVAGQRMVWQSASSAQTGGLWKCDYDGSYSVFTAVQSAEATAMRPEDAQNAAGRVGVRTSVYGNFGQAQAVAILDYRIYVPELDEPPFEPGFIPVALDWYANYETDALSEAGFRLSIDGQQELNDSVQGGNTTSSGEISGDIPAGGSISLTKSARCSSRIVVSLTPLSAKCSASADPVPRFDQARFDATWGEASFPLARYYAFSLSPVPEPGRAMGTLVGLATLLGFFAWRRRR